MRSSRVDIAGDGWRNDGGSGPAKRAPAGWGIVGATPSVVEATVAPADGAGAGGVTGVGVAGVATAAVTRAGGISATIPWIRPGRRGFRPG